MEESANARTCCTNLHALDNQDSKCCVDIAQTLFFHLNEQATIEEEYVGEC